MKQQKAIFSIRDNFFNKRHFLQQIFPVKNTHTKQGLKKISFCQFSFKWKQFSIANEEQIKNIGDNVHAKCLFKNEIHTELAVLKRLQRITTIQFDQWHCETCEIMHRDQ